MPRVIMTSDEYVRRLKAIASRRTYYSNKFPNNLCYIHSDGRTSADCWNLIKSILNGYDVNRTDVGYYQRDLSNTGDVNGKTLLSMCTEVYGDFTKLKNGEPRYLYMDGANPHAGSYIGEVEIGGKIYNVIESTGSWERKVLYSWVDPDGTRRHYKGGAKNGKWTKHGKMTAWLDYGNSAQTSENTANPVANDLKEEIIMPTIKKGNKGKIVKIWQIIVGANPDGEFGPITDSKTREFQKAHGLEVDGIVGPKSWKAGFDSVR